MNTHALTRTLAGLSVIAFGVLALLGSLDIIDFGHILSLWWPLLLIWAGILSFMSNPRNFFGWPMILIVGGILFQLRELEAVSFNVWQLFWPVIIIGVGISIVLNHGKVFKTIKSSDTANAFMSGYNTKNQSDDYQGGSASAILGGVKIDLSQAKIKKEATLQVFAFMGAVEIVVPKDWVVETRITPILGGAENKASESQGVKSPKLIVVGEAVMGGIEIKY